LLKCCPKDDPSHDKISAATQRIIGITQDKAKARQRKKACTWLMWGAAAVGSVGVLVAYRRS